MLRRIALVARRSCGGGGGFPFSPIVCATLNKPFTRFTSTQNFEPVPNDTTDTGYPISVTPFTSFALPTEIHRQDVMRFFSAFKLNDEDIV